MNQHSPELLIYTPAIALEEIISRRSFQTIHAMLLSAGVVCVGGWGYSTLIHPLEYEAAFVGVGTIIASVLITLKLLRFFHNAFYYRGFAEGSEANTKITYEVARIFYSSAHDVTAGFARSPQGRELLKRLGLTTDEIDMFIASPRTAHTVSSLLLPEHTCVTFKDLGVVLLEHDTDLSNLLATKGITADIFLGTLNWTTRAYYQYKQQKRWWARENLSRFAGIGREWSYGIAYLLKKFSRNLESNAVFSHLINDNPYASERVADIEKVLTRGRESNIILVGQPGVGKMDIILRVADRIRRKVVHPSLMDRRFVLLDTDYLLAVHDTKQAFERTFITMMQQAAKAGNIILVIENFSGFVRAGTSISVDIPALIEPYLGAADLSLVFTDSPGAFHHEVEQLGILQKIDVLYIEPPSLLGTERILENIAHTYEAKYQTTLTFPALQAIAVDADRYIPTGVMPDKAVDLLVEIMGAAHQAGAVHVTEEFVQSYVSQKTGIPIGPIDDSERKTLLDLESKLHERVVGQDQAIKAISSAMRRARAGIQDTDRPMGSFLFLGPTGVGKTETAKALATVFFGNSEAMLRLDMSEYSGEDALERLLGTADAPGALSNMMQEHPYAVLLLDEFEKGSQRVHDLFLQILDEGRFTDARGTTINMRNTIVIATSNAGSNLIIEAVRAGNHLDDIKDTIISTIIKEGTYRPELINRFDGVITFEPLSIDQQEVVAKYLLTELQTRIADRGYTLQLNDALTKEIASRGYNPEFGARPMRRVIQDQIEEVVARKIISGALKRGDTITITQADLDHV